MTERRKNQSEEWTYFNLLFIYFITVNKYRFCISVIGYISAQIIGIGYKKSISVDHYYIVTYPSETASKIILLNIMRAHECKKINK